MRQVQLVHTVILGLILGLMIFLVIQTGAAYRGIEEGVTYTTTTVAKWDSVIADCGQQKIEDVREKWTEALRKR